MTRHFIPVGVSAVIGSHSAVVLTNAVLAVLGACVMMSNPCLAAAVAASNVSGGVLG